MRGGGLSGPHTKTAPPAGGLSFLPPLSREGYPERIFMNLLNSSHAMIPYILSYTPAHDYSVQDPFGKLIVRAKGSVIVGERQIFAAAESE